jgi:NTE family protein
MRDGRYRIALVLAGGAARGAYEVGVVRYILEEVAGALGRRPLPLDIVCGTSVGAINACFLAATADDEHRALRLVDHWRRLRVDHVVRIDSSHIFGLVRGLFGRPSNPRRGGILDPAGLGRVVAAGIDFRRIRHNLRAGLLEAVTVSTTHIATGRTTVFIERADGTIPRWSRDATIVARPAELTAAHALASATATAGCARTCRSRRRGGSAPRR